jgi:hypothetical protein
MAVALERLTPGGLTSLDAWWRAANYLTIGQIYLKDNALLRRQLTPEDIKPRLLGHWGTSPGLSFVYAHLSRLISITRQHTLYLAGLGHGGPALVAAAWLEGTYSQIYPAVSQDGEGMQRLFRQFSSPGGIPSHVSVTTPGSIHEGGELGYVPRLPRRRAPADPRETRYRSVPRSRIHRAGNHNDPVRHDSEESSVPLPLSYGRYPQLPAYTARLCRSSHLVRKETARARGVHHRASRGSARHKELDFVAAATEPLRVTQQAGAGVRETYCNGLAVW